MHYFAHIFMHTKNKLLIECEYHQNITLWKNNTFICLDPVKIFRTLALQTNAPSNHNCFAESEQNIKSPQQCQHRQQWPASTLSLGIKHLKNNIRQSITNQLEYLLSCLLRWSLQLIYQRPKSVWNRLCFESSARGDSPSQYLKVSQCPVRTFAFFLR